MNESTKTKVSNILKFVAYILSVVAGYFAGDAHLLNF